MAIKMEDELDFGGLMVGKERPSRSLSEQAYLLIRRKIISLELPPGGIVDEASLKDELGLGRTPIREALLRLSLEKLVTIVPRRGIFVTDIVITDLQRLFEIRLELETLAARLAARRGTERHWLRMDEVLNRLPPADQPADNEILIGVDEMCHRIMYEATENKFLQDTLITLYALSLRLWYYFLSKIGDMRGALEEHRHILEALQMGDEILAGDLIEKHIRAFQVEIQASMLGEGAES